MSVEGIGGSWKLEVGGKECQLGMSERLSVSAEVVRLPNSRALGFGINPIFPPTSTSNCLQAIVSLLEREGHAGTGGKPQ